MMPTYDPTIFKYIEQDDEYMYFEVFELIEEILDYESRGVVFIGKVRKLE